MVAHRMFDFISLAESALVILFVSLSLSIHRASRTALRSLRNWTNF